MAWYTIKFSCGHSDARQLYGPNRERERKIQYFEDHGLCTDCWHADKQAKRDAANKVSAETNRDLQYGLTDDFKRIGVEAQKIYQN